MEAPTDVFLLFPPSTLHRDSCFWRFSMKEIIIMCILFTFHSMYVGVKKMSSLICLCQVIFFWVQYRHQILWLDGCRCTNHMQHKTHWKIKSLFISLKCHNFSQGHFSQDFLYDSTNTSKSLHLSVWRMCHKITLP